jgi:peptidoglycan/LPS O-acetylase OafA/YrhL
MSSGSDAYYRRDIDGLRALAVLSVLFYHAKLLHFTGGFVGVDVFFVISGYLISRLLIKELQFTGFISLPDFFARRMRRLFPALAVVILFTLAVWPFLPAVIPLETERLIQSIRYSIFGFANFYFYKNTGGYFDGANDEMPLLHFWSLSVEEQFYLVWPFFLLLGYRAFKDRFRKHFFFFLTILTLISFTGSQWLVSHQAQQAAFYMMPFRIWQLGLGALICLAEKPLFLHFEKLSSRTQKLVWELLAFAGLSGILFATFFYNVNDAYPGWRALPPSIGTAFLILTGASRHIQTWVSRLFSHSWSVFVGTISYSLYLWHWPLLAFAQIANVGEAPPIWVRAGILALSTVLAYFSYRFVETPFRQRQFFKKINAWRTISGALATSGFVCVLGLVIQAQISRSTEALNQKLGTAELFKMIDETLPQHNDCIDQLLKWNADKCSVGHSDVTKIIVLGDSHAESVFPIVQQYVETTGAATGILLSNHGVLPVLDRTVQGYAELKDFILSYLTSQKKRTSLVLSARWLNYLGLRGVHRGLRAKNIPNNEECCANSIANSYEEALTLMKASLHQTIEKLNTAGIFRILIPLPYPEFRYPVRKCLETQAAKDCQTSQAEMLKYRSDVANLLQAIRDEFPNVRLVDPIPRVCDGTLWHIVPSDPGHSRSTDSSRQR